jgi:hypothetical protein
MRWRRERIIQYSNGLRAATPHAKTEPGIIANRRRASFGPAPTTSRRSAARLVAGALLRPLLVAAAAHLVLAGCLARGFGALLLDRLLPLAVVGVARAFAHGVSVEVEAANARPRVRSTKLGNQLFRNDVRVPMTSHVIDCGRVAGHHGCTHTTGAHMDHSIETIVDSHLAAYCEPHAPTRVAVFGKLWNAQGRLVDPPLESRGHDGMSEQAAALIQQFPGHRFVRTTAVDRHHEFARYGWELRNATGSRVLEGVDFLALDVDGRIMNVVGFFGPLEDRP